VVRHFGTVEQFLLVVGEAPTLEPGADEQARDPRFPPSVVADADGVGDVEDLDAEPLGVRGGGVGDGVRTADGTHHPVAPFEELLGEITTEPADAGDEPGGRDGVSRGEGGGGR
jgi:hypothetical protein